MTDAPSLGFALPPGLILMLAGVAVLALPRPARWLPILAGPLLALAYVLFLQDEAAFLCAAEGTGCAARVTLDWLGFTLAPVQVDATATVFGLVFALMALAGGIFAEPSDRPEELAAAYVYAGAALSAVYAGDLITLFVFWEVMAIFSTAVIWMGGPDARAAGLRYAVVHFLGGVFLMAGIAGTAAAGGSIAVADLGGAGGLLAWLVLISLLMNAGGWPFNAWLADSYPRASVAGTVFLSAFTTKTAIYALIRLFPGEPWLLWIGLATILYGVIYALLASEIRRLVCYALVAQSGFMLVAVGIGTPLALAGATGHAAVCILYSALLFMATGAVVARTDRAEMSELGGLAGAMPRTAAAALLGGFAMAAMPGTAAYVSKSLISSAAGYEALFWTWLGLTIGSVGVMLAVGLKLPWGVFFGPERGIRAQDPGPARQAAMGLLATLILGIAVAWDAFYAILPGTADYSPYKAEAMLFQLELLAFAVPAFFLARSLLPKHPGATLDTDWLWRGGGAAILDRLERLVMRLYGRAAEVSLASVGRFLEKIYRNMGPDGTFARTRPSSVMALWMTGLLCALLIFNLF
ncbi:MAG: proton-conducting transporter membrane subunit [Paracoccaceae bacterium]